MINPRGLRSWEPISIFWYDNKQPFIIADSFELRQWRLLIKVGEPEFLHEMLCARTQFGFFEDQANFADA